MTEEVTGFGLRLGSLELIENDTPDYSINTAGEDLTLGNAVPASDVLESLLRDGDLTTTNRFGNREGVFIVEIDALDHQLLVDGGTALFLELDKPNQLTWSVPYGPDTVFEVVRSWAEFLGDDLTEIDDGTGETTIFRSYRVHVECLPFGHSVDEVTIEWTDIGIETPLDTIAGWTVVSGGAIEAFDTGSGYVLRRTVAGGSGLVLSRSMLMDEYIWIKTPAVFGWPSVITSVSIDGTSIPAAEIHSTSPAGGGNFTTIPTGPWRGQVAMVQFTLGFDSASADRPTISGFWTESYPNLTPYGADDRPRGIGAIDVPGSARAPLALISFSAPVGGAWLITGPDPNVALRERGAVENLYEKWTVVTDPVYLAGDYVKVTQRSEPQPPRLNPDGIWPQFSTDDNQLAYPSARGTAVSFFPTAGPVSVISASPDLPGGFHSETIIHEEHVLHPLRSLFAVVAAATGLPVPATIIFFPHWGGSHAGL